MRIVLVRHGESTANRRSVHNRPDEPLTHLGLSQAHVAADCLAHYAFDLVYVSPLLRAQITAAIILERHNAVQTFTDERLRERDNGVLAGAPHGTRILDANRAGVPEAAFRPQHGESTKDMETRVLGFLRDLQPNIRGGGSILIVSHRGPIHVLVRELLPGIHFEGAASGSCTVVDTTNRTIDLLSRGQ